MLLYCGSPHFNEIVYYHLPILLTGDSLVPWISASSDPPPCCDGTGGFLYVPQGCSMLFGCWFGAETRSGPMLELGYCGHGLVPGQGAVVSGLEVWGRKSNEWVGVWGVGGVKWLLGSGISIPTPTPPPSLLHHIMILCGRVTRFWLPKSRDRRRATARHCDHFPMAQRFQAHHYDLISYNITPTPQSSPKQPPLGVGAAHTTNKLGYPISPLFYLDVTSA